MNEEYLDNISQPRGRNAEKICHVTTVKPCTRDLHQLILRRNVNWLISTSKVSLKQFQVISPPQAICKISNSWAIHKNK